MKGTYDGAASVNSHPSSPRRSASSRAAARTPSGRPSSSSSSVRCSVYAFWSASAFCPKRTCNSLSSSALSLKRSRSSSANATPCRRKLFSVLSISVCCSTFSACHAPLATVFTRSYNRRSVMTFIEKRVISGSIRITTSCSSSLVQHSFRFIITALTRSSRREAHSSASTVFSKVGSSGFVAMASMLRSASAIAARIAGSKSWVFILSKGGYSQSCISMFSICPITRVYIVLLYVLSKFWCRHSRRPASASSTRTAFSKHPPGIPQASPKHHLCMQARRMQRISVLCGSVKSGFWGRIV